MSRTTILVIVAAILFLIAVAVALNHLGDEGKREVVNQYRGSMFSFTYPLGLDIEEYPNGSLALGSTTAAGFDSAVQLTVVNPTGDTPADFTAFMFDQARALCTQEQVTCEVVSNNAYETVEGEDGRVFTFTATRTQAGAAPQSVTFGPVYAYILNREEGDKTVFSTLLVHTPVSAVFSQTADVTLLNRVNDSVSIGAYRR